MAGIVYYLVLQGNPFCILSIPTASGVIFNTSGDFNYSCTHVSWAGVFLFYCDATLDTEFSPRDLRLSMS